MANKRNSRGSNLGSYLVPDKKSPGGSNPRFPSPDYFVRGGEQKNREVFQQSAITSRRRVDPDNEKTANFFTNFAFDHSQQRPVTPGSWGSRNDVKPTTMNADGKSAHALKGITVGGGQDDKGNY